ncbi:transcription factor bHLH52-like [Sesamum indicum]|uniref:Transcription factor bHLH52-like n=1 Tax=Sesamum indicum TaxID=4182 RepID=A0A6I9TME5_SESIN|nr:transcription factor bHLH52-like [Sesamum indicum]
MATSALAETGLSPELFNDNFEVYPDYAWCNIDHLFEPSDLLCSENCNSLLPDNLSSPTHYNLNMSYLYPEPFRVLQDFEPFHCLKRQKLYDYQQLHSDLKPEGLTDGLHDYRPEVVIPTLPEFPSLPPVYSGGVSCETVSKPVSGGSLSAQSIAARERRRKITEKTQELGKLIPGGQRMNTAEMFQAAYKYIKYLQAQVGILEFMGSYYPQEDGDSFECEQVHGLVESWLIQEKLYSIEKCLVPQKLVQELASHHQIFESKPQVLDQVRQLICCTNEVDGAGENLCIHALVSKQQT